MEIHERIKAVRKKLGLSQEEFAKRLGTTRDVIGNIEYDRLKRPDQKETLYLLICKEYNVDEDWLRTGEGEMFVQLPLETEIGAYVSELLEDDGSNPLYTIIKEIMHTYSELSPKSQEVLRETSAKLLENLRKRKEG